MKTCPSLYIARALCSSHLAEWWSSFFATGFGVAMAVFLHRPGFGYTVSLAGLAGLWGVAKRNKQLRMASALVLFLGLGWLPLYYYWKVHIPWIGMWVYATHSVLEGLIFVRVKHGLDKDWL